MMQWKWKTQKIVKFLKYGKWLKHFLELQSTWRSPMSYWIRYHSFKKHKLMTTMHTIYIVVLTLFVFL